LKKNVPGTVLLLPPKATIGAEVLNC